MFLKKIVTVNIKSHNGRVEFSNGDLYLSIIKVLKIHWSGFYSKLNSRSSLSFKYSTNIILSPRK